MTAFKVNQEYVKLPLVRSKKGPSQPQFTISFPVLPQSTTLICTCLEYVEEYEALLVTEKPWFHNAEFSGVHLVSLAFAYQYTTAQISITYK